MEWTLGDSARLKCGDVAVDGEATTRETKDAPRAIWKLANTTRTGRTRTGPPPRIVQTLCDTAKIGPGEKSANARDQPRLPCTSGLRDLFPLGRNPQHVLSSQGYSRRVETLRRHLADDALSALSWLSGKRGPFSFCTQSDAGRLCGAGGQSSMCDAGGDIHRRCANFCRGLI